MLTRPDKFANFQFNTGADRHVIVKIVSGSDTWMFSDIDMQLTDGHIYPLMATKRISIKQALDVYTKKWTVSDVRIQLLNSDYLGTGVTLSDEWDNILNATVTIYLASGGTVASLSDCLVRFVGVVAKSPSYTSTTISLVVADKSKTNIVTLPQNTVGDTSGLEGAGVEYTDQKLPLVYGDFVKTFDDTSDTGMAVALIYNWDSQYPKVAVSDHALNAITKLFAKVSQLPEPLQYLSSTLTADSSGVGTGKATNKLARVYLYPVGNFVGYTSEDSAGTNCISNVDDGIVGVTDSGGHIRCYVQEPHSGLAVTENVTISGTTDYNGVHVVTSTGNQFFECSSVAYVSSQTGDYKATSQPAIFTEDSLLASNKNDSDYATIVDRLDDSSDLLAQGVFSFDNYATGTNTENDLGRITAMVIEAKASTAADVTLDGTGLEMAFIWGKLDAERGNLGTLSTLDGTTFNTVTIPVGTSDDEYDTELIAWHLLSGHESEQESDKENPIVFLFQATTQTDHPTADGVVGNQDVLRIHELRLKVDFDLIAKPDTYFAECEGREYGSWITGRSSSFADGDMIEDPSGIIESILRDELGLADADIDLTTFIDSENTTIKARINFHSRNEMDSNKAIRQLAEQSTFAFFWSAEGKARLVDLSDTTPTTALRDAHPVIIPFSYIKGGNISVSKEAKIFNDLTYKSRWQEEYRAYRDTTNTTNATSITNYGTRTYESKWGNVAGAHAVVIADFLIGTDGIWSNQHNVIDFITNGYTGADIQIGDWIEIHSDMDAHVKVFGSSWSGKQFLVIGLTQSDDSTTIKGIELF